MVFATGRFSYYFGLRRRSCFSKKQFNGRCKLVNILMLISIINCEDRLQLTQEYNIYNFKCIYY